MEAITRVQAMALFRLKKSPRKPIVSCPIIAPIKITLPERGKNDKRRKLTIIAMIT